MKAKKHNSKIVAHLPAGKLLTQSANLFPVVGIGASAGGLDAFKKLLKAIPENSGMAYVLVQHLDPKHESLLPELLQKVTKIPVMEITDDIKVQPDHIYVIPSNKIMVATDGVLLLAPRPEKSKTERNLPIDLFFTSLAEVHQEHAIGVVLSGTASDGTLGLKAIKEHGGITFAQDETTAEYEGMPHSAILAGVVDFVLSPEEMPEKLLEVTNKTILSDEELQNPPKQDEDVFKQILSLLRIRKGVDFTYYKQTTVRRRILRRMVVNKNEKTGDYLKFLRGNNQEQDLLYQDMLIPVTSFFRDKKTFEDLCNNVFPLILKNKIPGEITRIWVAGCSTGQEVYSFAICFKEFLCDSHERIQIFGTDLSEPAITKARTGLYEKSELDAVSPERLKDYFTKNNGGYQINKSIRDMCVFAHHNFLKDPPFGKMDVISCRNVLIYMEPYLQKKALTTFHYALNPKGFLLLGKSETIGGIDLFAVVEKNDKLYTRKDVPGRFIQVASQRSEQILNRLPDLSKSESLRTDYQKTADDILLTKYTPAGVVVNEAMDIVHFRGNTGKYLEQAPGKPSHNLLMMAKNGLGFELRNILHKAKTENVPVVKENIPLSDNGSLRNISIEAVPLPNTLEPYYLVLFHENNLCDTDGLAISNRKKVSAKTKKEEKDIQIKLLEQELAQAREDMRSITEDQEASNEELQSANEELLSGSEELQSLNEELETSKEELQSTNEELTVLNYELINLNEQITDARNYSESIVSTLYQPLLVLNKNLRVKTANNAFYKTYRVNEQETEGVLIYDLGNRQWNIPELRTLLEEMLPQKKQITDFEVTHTFTSIGKRIILLSALEIIREKKEEKLILLSIEDITESREAAKKIEESEKQFRNLVEQAPVAMCVFRGDNFVFEVANEKHLQLLGKTKEQVMNIPAFTAIPEAAGQGYEEVFEGVYKTGVPFIANESPLTIIRNGKEQIIYLNFVYKALYDTNHKIDGVISVATDVTEHVLARNKIEESEKRFEAAILAVEGITWTNNANGEMIGEQLGWADLTGQRFEEYQHYGWANAIHPDDAEPTVEAWNKAVANQSTFVYEHRIKTKQHGWKLFSIKAVPVFDKNGIIQQWVGVHTDITEQREAAEKIKENEKRQVFLLKLSDAIRKLNNPVDIEIAVTKIALDFMDADWCYYCTIEGDNLIILREAVRGDLPSVTGEYLISNYPLFNTILNAGRPFIVDDVHTSNILDEELKQLCIQSQSISFINVPVIKNGKPVGLLSIMQSKPRKWTDTEVELTVETAERTWAAVEKAKAEEALQQSEEKYRTLFTSINQGFALCELVRNKAGKAIDFYVLEVNPSYEKQAGVNIEMVVGKTILQVFPTLDTWWIETYAAVVDSQSPAVFEHYFENTHRWLAINAHPGGKDGFAVLFNDITERKQAEDKLKESENRFRTMADASPVLIWTLDANGSSSYYNKTFLDFLGVSKDAEISDWAPIVHPDDVQFTSDTINAAIAKHRSYSLELRLLRADGQWRWVLAQGNPSVGVNNEFLGFVGSSVDITERKQAEETIAVSEHRYHEMIYSSPSLLAILKGEDMIIEIANNAIIASWGKGKDIIGKSLFAVLPEVVEQGFDKLLLDVYNTGEPVHAFETPITILRNGINELIYYNFVYQAQRNVNGEIDGVAVIANEVTPQAILNKKIKESEAFNSTVLENSPDCIKMMDEEGRLQFMNSNGICLLEIDDFKSVENTHWWDMWEPDNRQIIKDAVAAANRGEKIQLQLFSPTAKGTPKWWDIIVLPLQAQGTEKNQHCILSVSRDITKQKLNELKEMELLGRFQSLVIQAPVAICVLRGNDYVIETINQGMVEMWGKKAADVLNKPAFAVLPELVEQGFKNLLDGVYNTGERFVTPELPIKIQRHGKLENAYVKFVYEPLREADGSISGVMALAHEITEQVVARKKVEESEEQFSTLAENMENLAWLADGDGLIYWYNKRWYDYTGTTLEEMQGWGWQKVHHPDHVKTVVNFVKEAWHKNEPFELTFPLRGRDGEYKWFLTRAYPIADEQGKVMRWIGTNTNIDEQKKAAEEIKYRKALLEAHNESSEDGILLTNEKGKIISFNKRYIQLWNMPQHIADTIDDAAIIAYTLSQLEHTDALIKKNQYMHEHPLESGSVLLKFKNGKIVERYNYAVMGEDGNFYGVSLTYRDITQQQSSKTMLEYRKALLEAHNEASFDGLLLVDAKGKIISYNHRFVEIFNMPQQIVDEKNDETALAFAMAQLVNPNQFIEKVQWSYEHPNETSTDILEFKDGKIVERHGYPVIAEDGSYYAWSWTFRDVTEIKKAELILRESEKNFRQLAELMPNKVSTADEAGKITYYSINWEQYSGISRERLYAEGYGILLHPDEVEAVTKRWQHSVETGDDFEIELRIRNSTGAYEWHLSRASAVKDEQGHTVKWIGSMTEIQKIKEEEERKGDFIKMVSHELKTPVTSIKGYVQLLLSILKNNPETEVAGVPLLSSLTRIDSQVLRLTRLITEMLDLTRLETGKLELKKELFGLEELVNETVKDITYTNTKHIINIHTDSNGMVYGDKDRLGQVLINLINNAIKYSTNNNQIDVTIYQPENNLIAVSVKDYGIGINKTDQLKIFERFFRAGGVSEHTYAGFGIGLYIANEIMERHQGFLSVDSEEGKGSTFTFTLPLATANEI